MNIRYVCISDIEKISVSILVEIICFETRFNAVFTGSKMLLHTLLTGLCAVAFVAADIPSTVEDHPTECKRCPYNLCTNKVIYDPETKPNMTLKCYTEGDEIVGDTSVADVRETERLNAYE
ncbi:unnamed protein product [Periconia digitata]|uniref:Uncharacterized protein n=1 Tax=Periconia digitata TaxID=1303443 RepID=A0A9W4U8I6_9PLEO|nr:unnamed protein product [Periconia digitata]